jgi:TAT (twin-arginine translocation) pathway signal sequence
MATKREYGVSRRRFLQTSLGAAAVVGFPAIVPARVLGQMSPSKQITLARLAWGASREGMICRRF